MTQQPIIVFDVNETLLDLETLRATFERIFNDSAAMRLWFAGLITYSEALTLAGVYAPFTDIGAAVLRMLAATRGIEIGDADTAELTDRFASMPLVVWQRRDAATGRQWQRRDGRASVAPSAVGRDSVAKPGQFRFL
jgi:FMN phosphatase YigB (HAD superfamily)